MKWWLLLLLVVSSNCLAGTRVVSLNRCYDHWLSELLPANWQLVATTVHGNRLETLIALQADYIIASSFTDPRLLQQLSTVSTVHVLQQPNDYSQWQYEVRRLGQQLQLSAATEQWLQRQHAELMQLSSSLSEVLIIMPNYYTWAHDSWVANLLKSLDINLVSPVQQGQVGQLRLEQLIQLSAERVVFEGFSDAYSRGQDWRYHPAVQRWLEPRRVTSISAAVAACPAINAVAYLQQMIAPVEVSVDAH